MANYVILNDDCLLALKTLPKDSIDSLVTDPPAGISFMGKDWDGDKGGRKQWIAWMSEVMRECLRVMKPGAHGLVWALPRTSHWTATALEDAGFEIRDVVTHLFGTGFPKSMDISKAIDKAAGAEREVIGKRPWTNAKMEAGQGISGLKQAGSYAGEYSLERVNVPVTAPATDAAREWSGWGTALKPASEHWILIRKPLSEKTIAANVLKWGTGGLNIDASRIGTDSTKRPLGKSIKGGQFGAEDRKSQTSTGIIGGSDCGRFPANLVLSHSLHCESEQCDTECAVLGLDEQSGTLKSGAKKQAESANGLNKVYGKGAGGFSGCESSEGGASRFFYCAKTSASERGEGNTHPTVKPQKLMQYLIKMVTPTGGLVLDPFMGSGSTGCSAIKEGFLFIGIEKQLDYYKISENRLAKILSL